VNVGPCMPRVFVAAELLLAAPAQIAAVIAAVTAAAPASHSLRRVPLGIPCMPALPFGRVARLRATLAGPLRPRVEFRCALGGSHARRSGTRPVLRRSGRFSARLGAPRRRDG